MVLLESLDQVDSVQYVGNVIYPSLGYLKLDHSRVEVQLLVGSFYQKEDEFFGKFYQAVISTLTFSV